MKHLRDWLIYTEDKINAGYGAYWWVMRKQALRQLIEAQLKEFDRGYAQSTGRTRAGNNL